MDLSDEDFKKLRGYRNTGFNSQYIYEAPNLNDVPESVNWWLKGMTK